MPDPAFVQGFGGAGSVPALLRQVQRRWRLRAAAHATVAAGAMFAPIVVFASFSIAIGAAVVVAAAMWWRGRSLTGVDTARLIEQTETGFDNLLVTAAELDERPRSVNADILGEIQRQAADRAVSVDPSRVVPLLQPIGVAVTVLIGCGIISSAGSRSIDSRIEAIAGEQPRTSGVTLISVRVTPPAYTNRPAEVLDNPLQVAVVAGSRINIMSGAATLRDWMATRSEAIELRVGDEAETRFLSVMVIPDAAPLVRVVTPGKDAAFAAPQGQVPITIESRDDLGLASLALRFTKASGGGENLAFSEGEIPLRVNRSNAQQWQASATLALESLALEDGDILVYRAIARDTNPAGAPVQSEQYLIEIGRNAEIADAGFSLPSAEKKYAISQQMVIYKTERLIASRKSLPGRSLGEGWLDETRGIGVEQRMVRAEVVFLGGGEVEDEVEEAAHSNELTEGRLQNTGRAEMLRAINAMSRAEAQLNDGRAEAALVFEREALASLERALDRRRYFMRTLPDRSRIDATRRLTGERRDARSWTRDQTSSIESDALEAARRVMRDLAAAAVDGAGVNTALAARIAALDPSSKSLQAAAVAIASAASDRSRVDAARQAMTTITAHTLRLLPRSATVDWRNDALGGVLADELARRPRQ